MRRAVAGLTGAVFVFLDARLRSMPETRKSRRNR
jgi:hypothetical protein